jgi:hypothetical protein
MAAWYPEPRRPVIDLPLRALYARLENPYWMPEPASWVWDCDGRRQGPALLITCEPGLANLLWLTLDMGTPPQTYDMSLNPVMSMLMLAGSPAKLAGEPLFDQAALHTLQEFHDLLPAEASGATLTAIYPLLKMLAARRLRHAHT